MTVSSQLLKVQSALVSTAVAQSVVAQEGLNTAVSHSVSQGDTETVGIAFLGAFYAGHRHVVSVWVKHGSAEVIRIEVHGSLSRMGKVVVHIARDGSVLLRGEEVDSLKVTDVDDGLQIQLSFRAYASSVEWVYLFGRDFGDKAVPVLWCRDASLEPLASMVAAPVRHLPLRQVGQVSAICQSFTILNNVFSLTFELAKPGSRLLGLSLSSELKLAHAGWWTWNIDDLQPEPGERCCQRKLS